MPNLTVKRLRNAMQLRGMTVEDLANELDVTETFVTRVIRESKPIKTVVLMALAYVLDVDYVWLCGEESAIPSDSANDVARLAKLEAVNG